MADGDLPETLPDTPLPRVIDATGADTDSSDGDAEGGRRPSQDR